MSSELCCEMRFVRALSVTVVLAAIHSAVADAGGKTDFLGVHKCLMVFKELAFTHFKTASHIQHSVTHTRISRMPELRLRATLEWAL